MQGTITFRTMIEVLGRPEEYVENALSEYLVKLKADKKYKVLSADKAAVKKLETQDLWSVYAELEMETEKLEHLMVFCFEYMPSVIEIIRPGELIINDGEFSLFLSDLQGKLHHVDMVAKQMKFEHDQMKQNMHKLLRNYVTIVLGSRQLSTEQLSELTGVEPEKLADFLDHLIDEGHIDLKEGKYFLVSRVAAHGE